MIGTFSYNKDKQYQHFGTEFLFSDMQVPTDNDRPLGDDINEGSNWPLDKRDSSQNAQGVCFFANIVNNYSKVWNNIE